jgi:hypothetical protein
MTEFLIQFMQMDYVILGRVPLTVEKRPISCHLTECEHVCACVLFISVESQDSQSANIITANLQVDLSVNCYDCSTVSMSAHQPIQGQTSTSCLNCKYLTSKVAKLKAQCSKLIQSNQRLRSRQKSVVRKLRIVSKNALSCNAVVRKCMNADQLKALSKKSTRGMKWSTVTIKRSLKLHFTCGPTGYSELLAQNYPLPSRRTLLRSIQHVAFESGILSEVFQYLSIKTGSMLPEERQCVLTLDEMSITPSVELDNRSGRFIGDVTLPGHSGVATHSMVFMLGGVTTRWKQTVAYYFTGNSVDGTVLCDIVLNIIRCCFNIGLNVIAVNSDMGSANRAMWKKLGIMSTRDSCVNSFCHPCTPSDSIVVLADVPHLMKNLRNHVVNGQSIVLSDVIVKRFNLPSAVVSVDPIKQLADYDGGKDLKLAPKLTSKHLEPSHFDKMKVSFALSVFSPSVTAAIRLLVGMDKLHSSALTTAWFLETMNHWFDLMSSRHPVMALSRFNEEKYVAAIDFLRMVSDMFRDISIGDKGVWKPVQTGIILSTTSMIQVQHKLIVDGNFKFVLTSRFSQDCLENFFSCVRRKNAVPTPLEFKNSLRVLTVAQYLKGGSSGSYEQDDGMFIAEFIDVCQLNSSRSDEENAEIFAACESLINNKTDTLLDSVELNSLYYLAGYVAASVKKNETTCDLCMQSLLLSSDKEQVDDVVMQLVHLKEFVSGCLVSCCQAVFDLIVSCEIVFRQMQNRLMSLACNVKDVVVNEIIPRVDEFKFPECHNIKIKLINRFVRARLQFFAKQQRKMRAVEVKKRSCHEMSSKSMQMRKSVSKIK